MPGQLFPLDIADKNIGLVSSEMIYAILVTIIQKIWDGTTGGTEKDSKKDQYNGGSVSWEENKNGSFSLVKQKVTRSVISVWRQYK